jgi:glutathione synthase/RimK-type ligase-like ATP-grasp enzyme
MGQKKFLAMSFEKDLHVQRLIEVMAHRGRELVALDWCDFPDKHKVHVEYSCWGNVLTIQTPEQTFSPDNVAAVWVRRVRHAESQNPDFDDAAQAFATTEAQGVLNALPYLWHPQSPWVSLPDVLYRASRKPYQAMLAQQLGFELPNTIFSNDPEQASAFVGRHHEVALKPVASLWIENQPGSVSAAPEISAEQLEQNEVVPVDLTVLYTRKFQAEQLLPQLGGLSHCPAILQQYIPKELELRVTVVGERVFACAIYSQEHAAIQEDWRRQRVDGLRYEPFNLPPAVERLCIELTRKLEIEFGCLDLILTPDGRFVFLEINPLGQWLWIEQKTGLPIAEGIVDLLLEKAGMLQPG